MAIDAVDNSRRRLAVNLHQSAVILAVTIKIGTMTGLTPFGGMGLSACGKRGRSRRMVATDTQDNRGHAVCKGMVIKFTRMTGSTIGAGSFASRSPEQKTSCRTVTGGAAVFLVSLPAGNVRRRRCHMTVEA